MTLADDRDVKSQHKQIFWQLYPPHRKLAVKHNDTNDDNTCILL